MDQTFSTSFDSEDIASVVQCCSNQVQVSCDAGWVQQSRGNAALGCESVVEE